MSNVSGVIKSIQDLMRKDVGVDGDAQPHMYNDFFTKPELIFNYHGTKSSFNV